MNKQIEEMAKTLCELKTKCEDCKFDSICMHKACAKILYNAGYTQKVNDDEVVVSKDEYERLQIELKSFQITDELKEAYISQLKEELKQAHKETAREFAKTLMSVIWEEEKDETIRIKDVHGVIRDIARSKYGVEVE